jgi:hypothetical protein
LSELQFRAAFAGKGSLKGLPQSKVDRSKGDGRRRKRRQDGPLPKDRSHCACLINARTATADSSFTSSYFQEDSEGSNSCCQLWTVRRQYGRRVLKLFFGRQKKWQTMMEGSNKAHACGPLAENLGSSNGGAEKKAILGIWQEAASSQRLLISEWTGLIMYKCYMI